MKVHPVFVLFVFTEMFAKIDAVRGSLILKKTHQNSLESTDSEEYFEDSDGGSARLFSQYEMKTINKESVFEQGETRDFLHFLQKIEYDHRQCPESKNGEAVHIFVSVVVSNVRAVSEVTMDYNLELFYREAWHDPRLSMTRKSSRTSQKSLCTKVTRISCAPGYVYAKRNRVKKPSKTVDIPSITAKTSR